jgi:hypothetical protein
MIWIVLAQGYGQLAGFFDSAMSLQVSLKFEEFLD